MDDKTLNQSLKQTLTERAQHTVPDDYDLWSHIQEAIDTQEEDPMKAPHLRVAPSNPRRTRRLIYVLVAALLLTTTAVYAVYQTPPPLIILHDPGIEGIKAEGYTTPLNLIERNGDIEVQLNWGYVDSSRTVLNYQIFGVTSDGKRSEDHHYTLNEASLNNPEGILKRPTFSRGTGSVGPEPGDLSFIYRDEVDPTTLPDTVNLQLELIVVEGELKLGSIIHYFLPFGLRPTSPDFYFKKPELLHRPEDVEPLIFEFTLPVQRGIVWEPDQAVEANGNAVTLTRISALPSRMSIELCYRVPDGTTGWWPDVSMQVAQEEARQWGGDIQVPADANNILCNVIIYDVFSKPGMQIDLKVNSLFRGPEYHEDPQPILELQKAFAERGLEMELAIDAEGKVNGFSFNVNDPEAYREIMIEYGYLIEGPWEFSVEIPEP